MLVSKTEEKLTEIKKTAKGRLYSGFDPQINYIDILWRNLVVKPYLAISSKYNDLISKRSRRLLSNILKRKEAKVDEKLMQQLTTQAAENISNKIEERLRAIKIIDKADEQKVKIKTDFIPQIEDESLNLVSNIGRIGPKLEKEKFDIEEPVKLLKMYK